MRADLSGRSGKWKEAAADYARLIEIAPTNHMFFHHFAPVLLIAGDLEGYHQLCRQIMARFGSAKKPHVADRMAMDCLLLPPSDAALLLN